MFDVEQRDFVAVPCESGERIEDRLVFGFDADEVIAAAAVAFGDAADGEVVAFGGAAGEDDFFGVGADGGGDGLAGIIDRVAGVVAEGVTDAAGVAVLFT